MSELLEELERLEGWAQMGFLWGDLDPFFQEMEREARKRIDEIKGRLAAVSG